MRKAITEFLTLVFVGLLSIAALPSVACADEAKSDAGTMGITFQDAWQFMNEKSSESAKFQEDFGKNAKDFTNNRIPCGEIMCNLDKNVCMRQASRGTWSAIWRNFLYNAGAAIETAGGAAVAAGGAAGTVTTGGASLVGVAAGSTAMVDGVQRFSDTVGYRYRCVSKSEEDKLSKGGWENAKGKGNVNTETTTVGGTTTTTTNDVDEDEQCYNAKNTSGKVSKYCVRVIGDSNEVAVYAVTGKNLGCEVIPVRWYNNKQCTFCFLLGGVYKAADEISGLSYQALAAPFAITIVIGLAIWLAIKTLAFVSSLTKQDAAKYITELLKQSYKFMIAFFALLYYDEVFIYIIRPLLSAGLDFGTAFISVTDVSQRFDGFNPLTDFDKLPGDYARNISNEFYSYKIYANLENLAYNVNLNYALLQTIGGGLICLGWHYLLSLIGTFEIGLGLASVIYGIAFWAFGFLLCLAFVFYLFDAVVQLGIVGGLLPFLIASWPFKITSKYTSTGFKMFLNSIFTFMMIGVVVKISMELISAGVALNTNNDVSGDSNNISADLQTLAEAIDNIDTERLREMVNVLSVGFLLFMFASIMGFLLLGRVNELVNRFAGGGMKGSAPSIATMGASSIKGMASKVTAPTSDAVGKWVEEKTRGLTKRTTSTIGGALTLRPVRRWIRNKANAQVTRRQNREVNVGGGQSGRRPDRNSGGEQ